MKNLLLFLFCIPFFAFSQTINEVDSKGLKQGDWKKTYENGNTKYDKANAKNRTPHADSERA